MKLSLVIPARNEEKNIEQLIKNFSEKLQDAELIVVSNGCTDRTPEVVEQTIKFSNLKNVKHLIYREKIGKGASIVEGFKIADGDIIGFVDSDGAFTPEDVKSVSAGLIGADGAIASKWKGKNLFSKDVSRRIPSRVWNLMANILFNLNISDTQAGLKLFTKEAIDSIDLVFSCRGWAFDVELLYKIKKAGFRINEIYIGGITGKGSFNLLESHGMFFELLKLWIKSFSKQ